MEDILGNWIARIRSANNHADLYRVAYEAKINISDTILDKSELDKSLKLISDEKWERRLELSDCDWDDVHISFPDDPYDAEMNELYSEYCFAYQEG